MAHPIEIAVISGQGGSGKTVLTSSLARLIESKVIAECDVEAPNLHLLLNPVLRTQSPLYSHKMAVIDQDICDKCGECLSVCRFHAIRQREEAEGWSYSVVGPACEGCAACAHACPQKAIEMKTVMTGSYYISDSDYGPFVHASLKPGRVNSGRLVAIVRREAKKVAAIENLKCILTDGPPGIGCPAIATVAGISLAVVVTEPTVGGIHDFRRVLALTRCLGVETAVVMNKYDLNPEVARETEELVASFDIPLIGRIPFSPQFNQALCDGTSVLDRPESPLADEIIGIARRIEELAPGAHTTKV